MSSNGADVTQQGSSRQPKTPLMPVEAFRAAISFHQQGRLREAERLYQAILEADRHHFGALHYLGTIRVQQGNLEDAIRLIRNALDQDPNSAEAHNNLGIALQGLTRYEESIAHYERALALNPDFAMAHNNLGSLLQALNRPKEAIGCHERALALRPDYAEAHNNLGNALQALNRHEEAIACYEKALALKPDYPDALYNLGNVLQSLNRSAEAIAHYEKALLIEPDYAAAHNNLGIALHALKRHDEAIGCHERALALRPDYPEAHSNLGNALQALNRHEEAITHYEKALAIKSDYAEAHNNLGNAFQALSRFEEAITCFEKALALKLGFAEAHYNLGNALQALNRHQEAIARYERALALKPDYAEAQWNDALARLTVGDFEVGWKKYEWRWSNGKSGRPKLEVRQPMWLGDEKLSGKTVLLYAEQGFGDTLQFARYVPLVARQNARVMLEVQPSLVPLLTRLQGVSVVCARGEQLPPFDCHCPLLSLPLAFGTTPETIPAAVPYLFPPADKIAKWRPAIEQGNLPWIGLTWAGSPTHGNDRNRSIPLRLLRPLLQVPGLRFVALQKELRDGDAQMLGSMAGVTMLRERLADFSDTAAVISMLDLVITVDTSVAHLAGALGKPVWVLLPFSPDWRWLLDRDDSPWYPSARLFRQPAIGNWESVVTQVGKALQQTSLR